MTKTSTTLFEEVQQFRKPWLMILLLVGMLVPIGILVYTLTIQEINVMELTLTLIAVLAFEIPIFVFFYYSKLESKLLPEGFTYRWWPLQKKFRMILPDEAMEIKIRESPTSTYGMHWRLGYGWVNNVGAKRGFQFKLKSGKNIFIGSEHISELKTALEKVFKKVIEDKRNEF
jgi:hypothetical protein